MGTTYWEDSTSASGLQSGMYGYAGYFNGPFANLSSIRRRFPGKPVMGYATRISNSAGADAIDCEPGTLSSSFSGNAAGALQFVRQWKGGSGLFGKPLVYMMASWQRDMENYLAANGVPRSAYYINSSHATGSPHFCGPATCGHGKTQADVTQFQFARSFDKTVMQDYVLSGHQGPVSAPPPPAAVSYHEGNHGPAVAQIRVLLDAFGAQLPRGADGGSDVFGRLVYGAVVAFQVVNALAPDGIVGPVTWAALHNKASKHIVHLTPPPPVAPFTFDAPRNLVVKGGHTGFSASWAPPANAAGHPELKYQLYVYHGPAKDPNLVTSYPRHPGSSLAYSGGHLAKGDDYTLHVVAGEGNEARSFTYASATFKTS